MPKEVEAQILFIDYDEIIKKLKTINAEMVKDWIKFRIGVFYPCLSLEEQKAKYNLIFTRVRDEGLGTVTITTKTKTKSPADDKFMNEYEIETKNTFDECTELLLANHLTRKAYQEKLRQKWIIPSRPEIKEIVFDIWPGMPIYMEVEAESESVLMNFLTELGINKDKIRYSGASMFYNEILGINPDKINNNTPILNFATVKDVLHSSVNDKNKFNKILQQQKTYLQRFGFSSLLHHKSNKASISNKKLKTIKHIKKTKTKTK